MRITWMFRILIISVFITMFSINSFALLRPDPISSHLENRMQNRRAKIETPNRTETKEVLCHSESCRTCLHDPFSIERNPENLSTAHNIDSTEHDINFPVISGRRDRRHGRYRPPPPRQRKVSSRGRKKSIRYTIKRGDTLFSLSRRFHVSVDSIRSANRMRRGGTLYFGQRIRIPAQGSVKTTRTTAKKRVRRRPRFRWPLGRVRTIRKDTLDGVRPIGIIITGSPGAAVLCSAGGTVKKIGRMRGYGQYVIVKHGHHYLTVYANLSRIFVQEGQHIPRGRRIGRIHSGDHSLHFQINRSGKAKNPLQLLPRRS